MRILLTGGAGYVGSACLRWLLAHGHDPIAYDSLREGNVGAVPDAAKRLIQGDIAETDRLAQVLRQQGIEAVMHFAALASVPESVADPEAYYRVNVGGTKSVLDAMRATGVRKILFSSTAATYGFHAEMPLHEDSPQTPETPYGSTKLAAEWLIKDYTRAYGMGYTLLRYFNAAGADPGGDFGEDRRHEAHLIPLTLQVAVGRRPKIMIYGNDYPTRDGTCVRDYVHTADLAQAHQLAVESLEPGMGRAYNLGSGTGATVLEVLRACEDAAGRPISHEIAGRRPGDPATLIASSEKIVRELSWSPRHSDIREIVRTAWEWHHRHPGGYTTGAIGEVERMKAVLIGTGQIAQQHLACLRSLPAVTLAGVCDLSRSLAEAAAERYGVAAWFTDHRAMLEEVRPDVVHITTPPPSHFRLVMDALAAGAHVIVEKPITTAHEQVAVLLRSAAERERILIEDYSYLFDSSIQRILDLVRSGELGEVVDVEVSICVNILAEGSPFVDRNVPHPCVSLPGGAIADFLSHLASLAHGFVGAHQAVRTHWSKRTAGSPLPCDEFRAIVAAERGTAFLSFSAHAQPESLRVRVNGTRMRAAADLYDGTLVINRLDAGPKPIARLRDRLREARDLRRGARRSLLGKFKGPGVYSGLWNLLSRAYQALNSETELPISMRQIAEVNALVAALTAEEFQF